MKIKDKILGSMIGLAVGDALGASVEFKKRNSYPLVETYLGGGEFNLPPGFWTDDTSLALCLTQSLIDSHGFNLTDQMNKFLAWWQYGYMSSTGFCFDIGNTTKASLNRFIHNGKPLAGMTTDPATNGAIMRLAPIPIYYKSSLNDSIKFSALHTSTTHAPIECVEASMILAYVLHFCLEGKDKNEILKFTHFEYKLKSSLINLVKGEYKEKLNDEINGLGLAYNTLEAALFAFYKFNNFIDGLKFVVNLGDDTDTVGAVYGQIAGAYYGHNEIPKYYIENLHEYKKIKKMTINLMELKND